MNSSASAPSSEDLLNHDGYQTFKVLWLCGIVISILCFLIQITFFILIRSSRKIDEKILCHITFTRIVATVFEFCVMYVQRFFFPWRELTFGIYFTSDFAIVCWMLVFTKHLYDKIVIVFNTTKIKLIIVTVAVWLTSAIFGAVAVYLLRYNTDYFIKFCTFFYVILKLVIQIVNSLIYIRIFYVAFRRRNSNSSDSESVVKVACVAFLLIVTTCIQIIVTDIIAIIKGTETNFVLVKSFCVINSVHVVPLTVIFIIIMKAKMRQTITKTVTVRLMELVT
ncbi:uncharacterized protein LOC114355380 [Ostrinia furnacalis]|uniref:uncharacterized protein LOC114355380 n=1 Tax=Ostrinia furnacalis TaxID=93504 RepID=UPI00103BDF23|nr:uncharacterized protein LOC114355380 [Ostrinia furnacalis]XP_028163998.1 uncharacterized protein LOC114355380 [Ostrinia furnacalis]